MCRSAILIYRGPTHYMAARIETEPSFLVVRRTALLPVEREEINAHLSTDDVAPDDRRFLMVGRVQGTSRLNMVADRVEGLKRRFGGWGSPTAPPP